MAQTQGAQEADNAATAAAAFSLSGTIVYFDMENYNPDGGQCSSAVIAFLTGWANEMHTDGYQAGVYGNPLPAEMDFSQVTPLPDDVMITKPGPPSQQITIWGLSPLNDGLWANNQRIHQYQVMTNLTFGGVTNNVDSSIEAATVVAGTGTKSPIFNLATFRTGLPHGINNGDVQYHGLIVGNDSRGQGFQYDQLTGSVTSIPGCSGATSTALEGINDANIIVGSWLPSNTQISNGFQYSAGACTTIDYPGTTYTTLGGVNDNGTMAGYEDSTKQAFLYNAGWSNPFSLLPLYPGAEYTYGEGINGVGHVVGNYVNSIANGGNSLGFYWNGTSFTSIDCGSHSGTVAWGINDNDQVVGQCQDANLNNVAFLYDAKTGTLTTFGYSGASGTYAYGINDNGQIVGQYSKGGKSSGFLASTHAQ